MLGAGGGALGLGGDSDDCAEMRFKMILNVRRYSNAQQLGSAFLRAGGEAGKLSANSWYRNGGVCV